MKENIITFYPWGQGAGVSSIPPQLARLDLPDYWKDMPRFHNDEDYEKFKNGEANRKNVFLSMKHCMPYYDAMIAGYHYVLHTDMNITINSDNLPEISFDSPMAPASPRILKEMPTPYGHYNAHFGWQMHWGFKTPPGWSALITHPINRYDLPFTTVSGLADYDVYPLPGNVSFHIKDNFSGIIKAGTPIFSIIPIKRDNWKAEFNYSDEFFQENLELVNEKETVPMGHYKKGYREGLTFK